MVTPEPLITKAEVARRLGVSRRTVNRYTAHDGLPIIRLTSSTVRYDWAAVQAWLAQHRSS